MSFSKAKIEFIIPLLAGVFCSLFLCAFLSGIYGIYINPSEFITDAEEDSVDFLFSESENISDPILEYYKKAEYTQWVIDFFTGICSSRDISYAILYNSARYNISPALAFSLCWEESRFNPRAINRNRDGSVDRGLFQLNSKSFPTLDLIVFFDIQSNAYYGLGHLRYCLDAGGSEISALAMYNAGTGRVRSTGAPETTLKYISRILNNKSKIESRFHSRLIKEEERRMHGNRGG